MWLMTDGEDFQSRSRPARKRTYHTSWRISAGFLNVPADTHFLPVWTQLGDFSLVTVLDPMDAGQSAELPHAAVNQERADQACARCHRQKVKCVPSGLSDRCERYVLGTMIARGSTAHAVFLRQMLQVQSRLHLSNAKETTKAWHVRTASFEKDSNHGREDRQGLCSSVG